MVMTIYTPISIARLLICVKSENKVRYTQRLTNDYIVIMSSRHLFAFIGSLTVILAVGGLISFREPLEIMVSGAIKLMAPDTIISDTIISAPPLLQSPSRVGASSTAVSGNANRSSQIVSPSAVSIGPKDARVTVVEFLDFQCPFCRAAHPTFMRLLQEYQGQSVRFVFRHFPIVSIHPHALPASNASLCAHEQGQFLPYYNLLYTRQDEISLAGLVTFARELNLNLQQFNSCLAEKRYESMIKEDVRAALDLGVEGTPTWFINDVRLVGALPYETFKNTIENELNQ